jgi:hypothetical protein
MGRRAAEAGRGGAGRGPAPGFGGAVHLEADAARAGRARSVAGDAADRSRGPTAPPRQRRIDEPGERSPFPPGDTAEALRAFESGATVRPAVPSRPHSPGGRGGPRLGGHARGPRSARPRQSDRARRRRARGAERRSRRRRLPGVRARGRPENHRLPPRPRHRGAGGFGGLRIARSAPVHSAPMAPPRARRARRRLPRRPRRAACRRPVEPQGRPRHRVRAVRHRASLRQPRRGFPRVRPLGRARGTTVPAISSWASPMAGRRRPARRRRGSLSRPRHIDPFGRAGGDGLRRAHGPPPRGRTPRTSARSGPTASARPP